MLNLTEQKKQISLEHMLTMSAGFEWHEIEYSYSDDRNTFRQWSDSEYSVQFLLDLPMSAAPGEEYAYNTGISHALSAIIKESTGVRADSFALDHLFAPLGISDYYWPIDNQDVAYGGHGVWMKPRDMAKFGYLYLMNGVWDGEQIVPADWVERSRQAHMARKYIPDDYYGYQWWVSGDGYYSAVGFGGQWIIIVPEHDLVVVFNNHLSNDDEFQRTTPERLLTTYILPSIL
jgi:CubicO group peptidase (beta-lactamase class C family)